MELDIISTRGKRAAYLCLSQEHAESYERLMYAFAMYRLKVRHVLHTYAVYVLYIYV